MYKDIDFTQKCFVTGGYKHERKDKEKERRGGSKGEEGKKDDIKRTPH